MGILQSHKVPSAQGLPPDKIEARSPSGKAGACKAPIGGSIPPRASRRIEQELEILEEIVPSVEIHGKSLAVDDDGHLLNTGDWNEDIAREIALQEGIGEITDEHWVAMRFIRRVHLQEGAPPSVRRLTRESGVHTKALYRLFPGGPAKMAAKIAGVPKPRTCV